MSAEQISLISTQASTEGKADYRLDLELKDSHGEVVAISQGLYQMRKR